MGFHKARLEPALEDSHENYLLITEILNWTTELLEIYQLAQRVNSSSYLEIKEKFDQKALGNTPS
jgi:hypothetical protein